jgi:ribosome production factor 2
MLRKIKAKSAAGKRELDKREPQVHEDVKSCLFLKSTNASEISNFALKEINCLKKPHSILFSKKNKLNVWEDPRSLDFFSEKTQASFIVVSSSTKKRPHSLTFARMYDHQVLDMIQLEIIGIKVMEQFKGLKAATGHYPIITFQGEQWDILQDLQTFRSIFQDLFRGPPHAKSLDFSGIEHTITFSAVGDLVYMRVYTIKVLKDQEMPKVVLEEMGPRLDFCIRRVKAADPVIMKQATKVPKELKPKKEKNVEFDAVGHEYGRIHMEKQDLNKLETRKMKGLKRKAT